MKLISFILLLLYVSDYAGATETEINIEEEIEIEKRNYTCESEKVQGVGFSYCYRNSDATNSNDIVYFLHGLNGSEKTWFTQYFGTLMVQKWWKVQNYKPRIVGVSFGPEWLLVNTRKLPLLPFFTHTVMPHLEKKMGGLRGGKRHIIGQSMGGFNGVQLALRYPKLFARVALLCPAITTVGPYASPDQIQDYIDRTGASRRLVKKMLNISRNVFSNTQEWDNHDPLIILKNYQSPKKVHLFLSIGVWDGYGFQEGAAELYELAKGRSFFAKWRPVPGGHCNFNRYATAKFIMGD